MDAMRFWSEHPLTDAQVDQFLNAIDSIEANLPKLIDLSPDERLRCLKVGNAQRALMEQIYIVQNQHPYILPSYVLPAKYKTIMQSMRNKEIIMARMDTFTTRLASYGMALDDDAMRVSLITYHGLKQASHNLPVLKPHYENVKETYKHKSGASIEQDFPVDKLVGQEPPPSNNTNGSPT